MKQPDQVTVELQTLMRDGRLSQQNFRRWARYRVLGNSPQLAKDSRHLAGGLPSFESRTPVIGQASTWHSLFANSESII